MIELCSWSQEDFPLLVRCNAPDQMAHLGGPESDVQLRKRHDRFLMDAAPGKAWMFRIQSGTDAVGSIGYWERRWRDRPVYETGWVVLSEFQGQGMAARAAAALITILQREGKHKYLHAFPSPDNARSNAICRKLGFIPLGECDFEYPSGHFMRSNDWRLELRCINFGYGEIIEK
jgi:RimJ/RimL family protein N-acetyltransferase